jgi:hypothetical protein
MFYGVKTTEQPTSVGTPITATSGIVIAFGTAPIHQVDGVANEIVLANTYNEAVSALGYSEDWDKYTLCEVIYSHFKLYGTAPLILVNVLDPNQHKTNVEAAVYNIINSQATITGDAIASTIKVMNNSKTLAAGIDYDVFYEDGDCIIEALPGGAMENLSSVSVEYYKVDFEVKDLADEVIGGYNVSTGKSTGMELMDTAYFKGLVLPDILIAPGFSHIAKVAAVMAAKTTFSSVFRATCICDIDTGAATTYQQAATIKSGTGSFQNKKQIMCWPMLSLDGMKFHYSTQLAGSMSALDAELDGIPSRVASNRALQADSAVLTDGTEILLDLTQANYLRGQGIVTAYNFVDGFKSWGTYTAAYPGDTDPKDMFISTARMFNFVANSVVLTYWSRIDENLTPRYAESIIDELNIWLNSLVNSGNLLGARCELKQEENPDIDLMAGIVKVHIYMTPASPAQEIDYLLEYDVDYVSSVLSGSGE